MANEEQLSILKQGVDVWNKWREENPDVEIDFIKADLRSAKLSRANLGGIGPRQADHYPVNLYQANLGSANLKAANLRSAYLIKANLYDADLSEADLTGANLVDASLDKANLTGSDLYDTNLRSTSFRNATLRGANLRQADIRYADFRGANLISSKLSIAWLDGTIFANSDLSKTIGLEDVRHYGPSLVSIDTFAASKGVIPEVFLRGCGLSDADIEYAKLSNLELDNEKINKILYRIYDLRATQAIQISPLFISYSHGDASFVNKIENHLNEKGVRFWRDVHDMKSGRIETQVDRAIRQNPTVLLILSNNSLKSDWVEHEVRTARSLEREMKRDVLCPVALDDGWKNSPWAKRIMEQIMEYNILDFSEWKDDTKFENAFNKLIDGLELFYK